MLRFLLFKRTFKKSKKERVCKIADPPHFQKTNYPNYYLFYDRKLFAFVVKTVLHN